MPKIEKRGLVLEVKAKGNKDLKSIANNMNRVAKSSRSVQRNFSGLRNAFIGVFAGRGIRSVVSMADNIQLLGDRINAFVGDTEKGAETLNILFDAANRTNSSIDTLAEGFNRVALASSDLGLSTEDLVAFTTTLQNAFRIQGASAAEARGATIQLTQGLSSGALRGQELRSVLEASAVAADVLAQAVGVGRGELIKFAETGGFTSEVVLKAFAKRAIELDERAAKLGTTFGQTLTKATNEFKRVIQDLNKELGLSKDFETSVAGLVEVLKTAVEYHKREGSIARAVFGDIGTFLKDFKQGAKQISGLQNPLEKIDSKIANANSELLKAQKNLENLSKVSDDDFDEKITQFFGKDTIEQQKKDAKEGLDAIRATIEELKIERKNLEDIFGNEGSFKTTKKKDSFLKLLVDFSKRDFDALLSKGELTLQKLNLLFKVGKISIDEYRIAALKLEKGGLAKAFNEGAKGADEYREKINEVNIQIALLEGKLGPVQAGALKALGGIRSFSEETADAVTNAFGTLENQLFDFTKTGKFLFNDFAQAVLDDLARIVIRTQLIKPLIAGFTGGILNNAQIEGRAAESAFTFPQAKGGIYNRGDIQAFANGGVVNKPTFFPMKSGAGLMGEAGAEAILPLERVSGGDLGVKALAGQTIININNQAGVEVEVGESGDGNSKVLDITITKAVRNALNQGRLDKDFSNNFGLNRRGRK